MLTTYTSHVSRVRYHFERFDMPAVMAPRIGLKVIFFSAASNNVSKNSIVGNTQETVGTRSEENFC